MAIYSLEDIARAAYTAGFRGDALRTAVAVAMGEGGSYDRKAQRWVFDSSIKGDVGIQTAKWGPSVGPWQIRSVKAQTGSGQERDASALTDLQHNASAAFVISNGGKNWKPWTVYTHGIHKRHMETAQQTLATLDFSRDSAAREAGLLGPAATDPLGPQGGSPPVDARGQQRMLSSIIEAVADLVAGGSREWPTGPVEDVDLAELFPGAEVEPEPSPALTAENDDLETVV